MLVRMTWKPPIDMTGTHCKPTASPTVSTSARGLCSEGDDAERWVLLEAWDDEDIIYEGEWEDLLRSGK
jgi:hypothetical protein